MSKPGSHVLSGKGSKKEKCRRNLITICTASGVKVSGQLTGLRYGTREVGIALKIHLKGRGRQ